MAFFFQRPLVGALCRRLPRAQRRAAYRHGHRGWTTGLGHLAGSLQPRRRGSSLKSAYGEPMETMGKPWENGGFSWDLIGFNGI